METMTTLFTTRDYQALPEGFPAQLIEGRLVKTPGPQPGHQAIVSEIHVALAEVVGARRALTGPLDVAVDDQNVYQPDVVVLASAALGSTRSVGIPRLVVEVLSPSTAAHDRDVKTPRLLAAGVAEVWLVDPEALAIEVHDADGVRIARGATPIRSHVLEGFEVVPSRLLA
jgi:Uma2 family endonuclease